MPVVIISHILQDSRDKNMDQNHNKTEIQTSKTHTLKKLIRFEHSYEYLQQKKTFLEVWVQENGEQGKRPGVSLN